MLNKAQAISKINALAALSKPFLFVVDYSCQHVLVLEPYEFDPNSLQFSFQSDSAPQCSTVVHIQWQPRPISKYDYELKFREVLTEIQQGNSFLVNLTQPTPVDTNLSLLDLYHYGSAKYKLWIKDMFTVLSPECFVQIRQGVITSFPMKGTIDASTPHAEEVILNSQKEQAEHATIVDLIRNDLSMVAQQVEVKRYRYIDRLKTNKGTLLQVSSEIAGVLPDDYLTHLGDIIFKLLPAGSITGAPKPKTLEIIDKVEAYERGFYTGVCGYFDGQNLDSAVMIRLIENTDNGLVFKSGGGVTAQSELDKEYDELIQKVYVPIY